MLQLENNRLTGKLPEGLADLTSLEFLSLFQKLFKKLQAKKSRHLDRTSDDNRQLAILDVI